MASPKVTIITACRNSDRTIERTILSVRDQAYGDMEYIIVDANSNDTTGDIIRRHSGAVSAWIRESDNGIAEAWNKGIERASGEIVGIINADDFYVEDAVSTVVDTFARDPQCGFVFGDLRIVNEATGDERIEHGFSDYKRILRYDMLNLPHPTVFVRKEIYGTVGLFDTNYRIAMDYEFLCRMISRGIEGRHIPKILAVMREGGVSETGRITASREVMTISISYGSNRFLATGYFLLKCARTCTGRILQWASIPLTTQRRLRSSAKSVLPKIRVK